MDSVREKEEGEKERELQVSGVYMEPPEAFI